MQATPMKPNHCDQQMPRTCLGNGNEALRLLLQTRRGRPQLVWFSPTHWSSDRNQALRRAMTMRQRPSARQVEPSAQLQGNDGHRHGVPVEADRKESDHGTPGRDHPRRATTELQGSKGCRLISAAPTMTRLFRSMECRPQSQQPRRDDRLSGTEREVLLETAFSSWLQCRQQRQTCDGTADRRIGELLK